MSVAVQDLLTLARVARMRLETLRLPEPAVKICIAGLLHMEQILARPPRVAIMGEVNSGKTSVADLLLGAGVLPSSVVSNTHVPILISYAEELSLDAVTQKGRHRLTEETLEQLPSGLQLKRVEIGLPSERLVAFEILDTPGGYVPGAGQPDAQIFLWCTVATRAWTESERAHWTQLPQRCRHNGLLVATHRDALANADIAKVEQRLRSATAEMFSDVVIVTAAGATRPEGTARDGRDPDETGRDLLARVSARAAEIGARRRRKADRIIRHLARLTFHRLEPGPLVSEAQTILKSWEGDCSRLVASVDGTPDGVSRSIQALLVRFAHALSEARNGRTASRPPVAAPGGGIPAGGRNRAAAARRYVRLIGADLTALLRIDLAQWGMRDTTLFPDYASARSVLLLLANLDATFDEVGQRFAAGAPAVPAVESGAAQLAATRRV